MNSGPNWARRYGPNHRRICARPGCGATAAATLRFQPTQREAWLVELEDDAARTEGDLCARHAAGLVLPRGWQLHNNLAAERDASTPAPPVRRPRSSSIARAQRRRSATSAVELPGLSPVVEPPVEVEVAEAPPRPDIAPLIPEASPAVKEELAETLDAQTPLLRRAFGNVALPDE